MSIENEKKKNTNSHSQNEGLVLPSKYLFLSGLFFYSWRCYFGIVFQEAEQQAVAKQAKIDAHAAAAVARGHAAAEAAEAAAHPDMAKSPSDFSCHSYELFVGQEKGNDDNNKEKMSIRSEGLESVSEMHRPTAPSTMASKVRKVSTVSKIW